MGFLGCPKIDYSAFLLFPLICDAVIEPILNVKIWPKIKRIIYIMTQCINSLAQIAQKYDAIVLAVAHDEFNALSEEEIRSYGKKKHVLYDVKYLLKSNESDGRL